MRRGSGTRVRDESTWILTHFYIKAMLGIFLYIYPLLALSSLLSLCLLFNKIRDSAEQVLPGSEGGGRGRKRV
jgi:hypothetical protein